MKHLKMIVLAGIAALSLTAAAGPGTAGATTLFTDEAHTTYYAFATVRGDLRAGSSFRLTSGGSTIATCTESAFEGTTTNSSATWIGISIPSSSLTWGGCSQTTATLQGGTLDIMFTSGKSGEVVGTGFEVTFAIFGVTCTYGFAEGVKLGNLTGGSEPVLDIQTTVPRITGGFLCPSSAGWDAEYVITTPHAVFVGA